ncbi:MAG: methyltransferase domain-containing protein [Candidatus Bathyarchaeota archaeon]|nr:methyltransferase domain-containing protein [Candidatus Bathyarchaeota archaeon]
MLRDQTLDLLQRFGLRVEAALDEQQLIDPKVIRSLIEASGIRETDKVLEIGPGAGNITVELATKASKVFAVEKNPKFISLLRERLQKLNVEIIIGDALVVYLPDFDVLVSNLSYAIAEATLQRLKRLRFRSASIIVPSSLASTLTARIGGADYTKLTCETRLFFDFSIVTPVKPESYYPEPKTATSIIALTQRESLKPTEVVARHLLLQGDKKVGNALREALISASSDGYSITKKAAKKVVEKLGLGEETLEKRVASLSMGDLDTILDRLEHHTV